MVSAVHCGRLVPGLDYNLVSEAQKSIRHFNKHKPHLSQKIPEAQIILFVCLVAESTQPVVSRRLTYEIPSV